MGTLPAPTVGAKVAVIWGHGYHEDEQVGWVLNLTADTIRIASEEADDGRPDAPADWWRKTFLLSEVSVVVL